MEMEIPKMRNASEVMARLEVKEVDDEIGITKDYTGLYNKLYDLIEENHHDLCGCFSDSEAEERTEELIKLCLKLIPGLRSNFIDLLKSGKNNPDNTKSKFFKRFCYVIYELED